MINITDDSILRLTGVEQGKLVIPNQDGGKIRESGNPLFMGDDVILIYTMDWKETNTQYLYYSYCNKNDLTNWTHMGRMKIDRKSEDPYIIFEDGVFTIQAEDKPMPNPIAPDNVISRHTSTDWNYKTNTGTWNYDGTIYATTGGASYSPLLFEEGGKRYTFIEERYTPYYNHINIVDGDTRKVLIHWTDDLPIMVTDEIYKINDKYVQFFHSCRADRIEWVHNVAVSDNLLSGWKVLPQLIKPLGIVPVYTNKWNYLVEGSGGLYLGEPTYITPEEDVKLDKTTYKDHIVGFWAGASIANWTSRPSELKRVLPPFYTENDASKYPFILNPIQDADDDTDVEYTYVHLMNEHQTLLLNAEQIRNGWLKHTNRDNVWCSNRKAYDLMVGGMLPPNTGQAGNNEYHNYIDAQIECEVFGVLSPFDVNRALQIASLPIRTVADGIAEQSARFYVAMFSLALSYNSPLELLEKARTYINGGTRVADIYSFVVAEYKRGIGWEEARDNLYVKFQKNNPQYNGGIESEINFGATLIAILWGNFDYKKTVKIGTLAGWDSDCNATTSGCLVSYKKGFKYLESTFNTKISTLYNINRTRNNFPDYIPNVTGAQDTFELLSDRMIKLMYQPTPPLEEKDMLKLKVTGLDNNRVLLEWTQPGQTAVHFENDFGYFATKDWMSEGKWEFENVSNATKFRIRADSVGTFEGWVNLTNVVPEPQPEPEPNDNLAIAQQIIELAKKIT